MELLDTRLRQQPWMLGETYSLVGLIVASGDRLQRHHRRASGLASDDAVLAAEGAVPPLHADRRLKLTQSLTAVPLTATIIMPLVSPSTS